MRADGADAVKFTVWNCKNNWIMLPAKLNMLKETTEKTANLVIAQAGAGQVEHSFLNMQ